MNLEHIDTSTTAGNEDGFRKRSTHQVYRGAESLPCHCWADRDHVIGDEIERSVCRADLAGEGKS